MARRTLTIAMLCLASLVASVTSAQAVDGAPHTFAFLSKAGGVEEQRLHQVGACLDVVAPNTYALDVRRGKIEGSAPGSDVLAASRRFGFEVWPVINAQTGGSPRVGDPLWRERVAGAAAELARRGFYPGLTLDIEGLTPGQRTAYTALVEELAARLHASGRRLAVYAPRRTAARPTTYAGAYDWPRLAAAADLLLASGYNEHHASSRPGPITTSTGFAAMTRYAASISRQRIAPTLGAIGYRWPLDGGPGTLVSSLDAEADRQARGLGATMVDGEVSYFSGDSVVWYETGAGLASRAGIALAARMSWLALFSLGREPLSFWAGCGTEAAGGAEPTTPYPLVPAPLLAPASARGPVAFSPNQP